MVTTAVDVSAEVVFVEVGDWLKGSPSLVFYVVTLEEDLLCCC